MVDEVEITNVGGPRGVASEATLAALVSALNRRDTNSDRGLRLEALARNSNVSAMREQNKQGSLLGKTIGGLAGSAGGLIKEFAVGGNRISDFSRAVFGANSLITGLTTFTDNLIDTFREMSTIGGSFNNSLFEFIKTSGLTGMSLTEFSNLVINNSTQLRMLSGSVSDGAARFGQISRELRRNFGSNLTRVGFTMAEMNEVLLDYTDFSISRMGRETRSNAQLAKSASMYALELDQLSRLTGISRQQLAETIKDQQADQRVRAATANMTEDQARKFNEALAMAGSASPALKDAILDMADGIPDEDVTKRLMSVIPTFGKLSTEVENMSFEELAKFFRQTGQEIDEFSDMPGFQALIRNDAAFAGLADIGAGLRTYSDLTDEQIKKLLKEQGQRDRLTETLLNFETALNNLRSFILNEIIESPAFAALEQFGTTLADTFSRLFGDGSAASGAAGAASESFKSITETLIGSEGIITGWIESLKTTLDNFNAYIDAGGNPMDFWKEKIGDLASDMKQWFSDLFYGKAVTSRDRQDSGREDGLFKSIINLFNDFWTSDVMTNIKDTITEYFKDLVQTIEDMFVNSTTLNALLGIDREEVAARQAIQAEEDRKAGREPTGFDYENALTSLLGEGVWNLQDIDRFGAREQLGDELSDQLLKQLDGMSWGEKAITESGRLQQSIERLGEKIRSDQATEEEKRLLEQITKQVYGSQKFSKGTNGFENFGKESIAKLHGIEAVVPRNTEAGEYLENFFTKDWRLKDFTRNSLSRNTDTTDLRKIINEFFNDKSKSNLTGAIPVTDEEKRLAALSPQNQGKDQTDLIKKLDELNTTMIKAVELLEDTANFTRATSRSIKTLGTDAMRGVGR